MAEGAEQKHEKKPVNWRQFYELVRQTKPPVWIMVIAITLSIVETAIGLVIPLFTQQIVDGMASGAVNSSFLLLFLGLFVLQAVGTGVSLYLLTYIGEHIVRGLRTRLWQKIIRLPIPYFDGQETGETVSRITNDTSIIKGLITRHLVSAVTGVLSMGGAVIILLYLDWQMTLVMLTAVPIMLFIILPIGRRMYRISKRLQTEMASFTAVLSTVLSEIRLVKTYNAEEHESTRGGSRIQELFRYGLKEARLMAILNPLISLAMMVMLVFIIGYGGVRVASGALTAGELVAFILYLFLIIVPVSQFSSFFAELQKAMGATERLQELLHEPGEGQQGKQGKPGVKAHVTFKDVVFSYKPEEKVLKGVSFTIPTNQVTAIVGPSGAGKTTLFSLIERFYELDAGTILYGDTAIHELDLHEWRRKIGYVSQDSPLMSGTIRDNLSYGLGFTPSDEELLVSAATAYAKDFIEELPQGLDTAVGERGIRLSGGQKQRIAIARAVLRDPEILMLDEATASLDSESEQHVQKALQTLMQGRTTLVIAHRLSTVMNANAIIVMENGKETGIGTHEELYRSHELYKKLADHQMKLSAG
ncbi:ABC transporter ATP-binding protein [Paenalkalicoccus suaedae]|uniref:ABC transporter ATP-binding protein n=1 Tax=Paenalkalicoccus suaedae TaxID=2592382 RepID=A0A859FD85_9BACI|nr:ABC transporter ATP-binding protein [Paenalkalicoccus suaedae]QKS70176.1 ABC transporter ATP-binding protein [Paenalkalicoccus suaedae]